MRKTLVAVSLLALAVPGWSAPPPGYGVVESVIPIQRDAGEASASTGASRPTGEAKKKGAAGYLVRVRMDDGSVQVRTVKRAEVRVGQRALITNAGDVLPE